ncbi:MAG TPA: Ig-like domain-containing protein [Solirubrobacterales bacterium]|nr:Ig-like domain-containing protein [Solirubrobacterales bacterium]
MRPRLRHSVVAAAILGASVVAPAAASAKTPGPAVRWQSPTSGSKVSANLKGSSCKVAARTSHGSVKKVVFKVDGAALDTDTKAPYTCAIEARKLGAGKHKVTATAYDSSGSDGTATSIITVPTSAAAGVPNAIAPAGAKVGSALPVSLPTPPAPDETPVAPEAVTENEDTSVPGLGSAASNLVVGIDGGYFEWSAEEVEMRAQLGAAVTRHEWDIDEPVDAQDKLVYTAAAKVHTRIHALLGANELGNATHYEEWVIAFIERYGLGGSFWAEHPELDEGRYAIQTFELGNEPYYGGMTAKQYAETVRPTLEAVHNLGLRAKLILPSVIFGSDTSWMDTLYQYIPRLNEYFYAFADHPYWYGVSPATPGNDSPLERIATLRRRMDEQGAGDKPIFITEYGESTADCGEECVSETEQAAHIQTLLSGILAHPEWGVEMISFFQLHDWATNSDEREKQFGILRANGTPKPAYPIVQSAMRKYAG